MGSLYVFFFFLDSRYIPLPILDDNNGRYSRVVDKLSIEFHTRVVADVGKTRMWVHDASSGVDRLLLADCWPKRSSGVTWSGIMRKCESGSRETRQADTMVGACDGNISEHWPQISAM